MFEQIIKLIYKLYDKKFLTFILMPFLCNLLSGYVFSTMIDIKGFLSSVGVVGAVTVIVAFIGLYFLGVDIVSGNINKILFSENAIINVGIPVSNKSLILSMMVVPAYITALPRLILGTFAAVFSAFRLPFGILVELMDITSKSRIEMAINQGFSGIVIFLQSMVIVGLLMVAICHAMKEPKEGTVWVIHVIFIIELAVISGILFLIKILTDGYLLINTIVQIGILIILIYFIITRLTKYLDEKADLG